MSKFSPQATRLHLAHRIGLTGGMGAGKSTVSDMLADFGFAIVDADALTSVVYNDATVRQALTERFGSTLCPPLGIGVVDRKGLGAKVFAEAAALTSLNAIMQPAMRTAAIAALSAVPKDKRAVLDAALLFEAGWDSLVEASVVVLAPQALRVSRAAKRLKLPQKQLTQRLSAQLSDTQRAQKGDAVIYNVSHIAILKRQIIRVFKP